MPWGNARLRPKQQAGVRWLVQQLRELRAVGLFDDPGLGKTLQALTAVDWLGLKRVLVVSPAGARRVWYGQIMQWFPQWRDRIVILEPGSFPAARDLCRDDAIVLCAYDTLSAKDSVWAKHLSVLAWDLLIIDEAHYLKNQSQRTKALYGRRGSNEGIQASANTVLLLTGTPTPNHVGEMWQHMRTLWPQTLHSLATGERAMGENEFVERVCQFRDSRFGRQVTGSTEAGRRLVRDRLAPYVRRVSKSEALPELPPVTEQDVPLGLSPERVLDNLPFEVRAMERDLYQADDAALQRALSRAPREDTDERQPLSTLRRALGEQKIAGTVEWVEERLSCGAGKVLVFGWHVRTLDALHKLLDEYEPVLITGQTRPVDRPLLVDRFQRRPATRVFIGQIQAAGTALTLTAANEVIIMEPSWVPGENRQAIDRAHRMGQLDHVLAHYLYLPGTLDARILQVMRRKAAQTESLFRGAVDDASGDSDPLGQRAVRGTVSSDASAC
jgi:SNF2 family DNA or RNA helicase